MTEIGRKILDLAPGKGNPRNSEGAFITLKDGRILFIYSRYEGVESDDNARCVLSACESPDEGETWSESRTVLLPEAENAENVMSVSLLRMKDGGIGLFFLTKRSVRDPAGKDGWDCTLYLKRSADEGRTWGASVRCIPPPGYFVVNNDRVVRLSSGRIVAPSAFHRAGDRGILLFYYSDDDGATWNESKNSLSVDAPHSASGLQEPGVVELQNRVLWAWSRTDIGRQYESFSHDGGETWSPAVPSVFTSPCSPLSMKRMPADGSLLAVWNPDPNFLRNNARTPLAASVSKDDGKTWSRLILLEDDTSCGYCYTAIHFTSDSVLLAYCAGGKDDGNILSRLRIRKIPFSICS